MNEELISIIVPIYNGEDYLDRCIESICNQTYENLEIILINDGSKDNSLSICKKYEKKDSRIKVIDKDNSGVSATRNLGIKESKGNYIMFVDCDDYIYADCCKILFDNLKSYHADISVGKVLKSSDIVENNNSDNYEVLSFEEDKKLLYLTIYNNKFDDIEFIEGPVAKIYNKNYIIKNKIAFESDLRYGEDSLFNLECYFKANKIIINKTYVYNYIVNSNSASFGKFFDLKEEIKNMLNKHKEKLIELDLFELLKYDYYAFGLRQVIKIVKICKLDNKQLKELIADDFYKELLNGISFKMLTFKQKIKYLLVRCKMADLINYIYKNK